MNSEHLVAVPPTISPGAATSRFSMNGMASYLPSFNTPIVRKLLEYTMQNGHTNGESEGDALNVEKAVKSLVKKLKRPQLQELEKVLSHKGAMASNCIALRRVLEEDKQKSLRHRLPHLVYCRIWRWPDLQNHHELRPIVTCKFSFIYKKDEICVNPFHYIRVEKPILSPVLVPSLQPSEIVIPLPDESIPQNRDLSFCDVLPYTDDTPPPAYSEVESPGMQSGVGSPVMSPSNGSIVPSPHGTIPSNDDESCHYQPIIYVEPANWCSIIYSELDRKVGEEFRATCTSVTIDGGTDPSSRERFCLGLLCNVVRDEQTKQARQHIGKGLTLYYAGGEVYVECLSRCSIFVNSQNHNARAGWHLGTVVKVPTGCHLNLFNSQDFAKRLTEAVHSGFETCYQMQEMCKIKISFVKGWGASYKRHSISNTPCWIEITLNGPMQWLDKVLTQMGGPNSMMRSDS